MQQRPACSVMVQSDRIDLAARAFTSEAHRVVTFVPRDAEHLAACDVDHCRVKRWSKAARTNRA